MLTPRFISFVYWHDLIFGFTENGDCWRFTPPGHSGIPCYELIAHGPTFPRERDIPYVEYDPSTGVPRA